MGYKTLSLIQVVFIALAAFSVLDFAYTTKTDPIGTGDGLLFNKLFFEDDGLFGFLSDFEFWGTMHFWAYCFFIVAICQLVKALTVRV
jgi:hypothetical protein